MRIELEWLVFIVDLGNVLHEISWVKSYQKPVLKVVKPVFCLSNLTLCCKIVTKYGIEPAFLCK